MQRSLSGGSLLGTPPSWLVWDRMGMERLKCNPIERVITITCFVLISQILCVGPSSKERV